MKIYVEQYGSIWSFEPEKFIQMCKVGAKKGYVEYAKFGGKPLKSKPSEVKISMSGSKVFQLLDAEPSDFKNAEREVKIRLKEEKYVRDLKINPLLWKKKVTLRGEEYWFFEEYSSIWVAVMVTKKLLRSKKVNATKIEDIRRKKKISGGVRWDTTYAVYYQGGK